MGAGLLEIVHGVLHFTPVFSPFNTNSFAIFIINDHSPRGGSIVVPHLDDIEGVDKNRGSAGNEGHIRSLESRFAALLYVISQVAYFFCRLMRSYAFTLQVRALGLANGIFWAMKQFACRGLGTCNV